VGSPGGTTGRECAAAKPAARPSGCSTTGPGYGSPAHAPVGSTTPGTGPATTTCAATAHRRGRSWPASCDPATPRSRPDRPNAPPPPPQPTCPCGDPPFWTWVGARRYSTDFGCRPAGPFTGEVQSGVHVQPESPVGVDVRPEQETGPRDR
jgi:hypothetical protein